MPKPKINISTQDRVTGSRAPHELGEQTGGIPPGIQEEIREVARRRKAEGEIDRLWSSSGGAPGAPTGDLMAIGAGYYRQYVNGRIYYRPGHTPFYIYGSIGDKYTQLGGPDSWLGWPTSGEEPLGEEPFAQGGRYSKFEHGAIYWWPDTEAIELGDIAVRYTGLYCFGETDNDGLLTSSDEPYVIFGVVPIVPGESSTAKTVIYEDVDAGDSREDNIELYRGLPYGLSLSVVLMEHDEGNPDKYREQVKQGVATASAAVATAAGTIGGPLLSAAVAAAIAEAGPTIVEWVNKTLGTGDDHIGTVSFVVTPKDMVTMARAQRKNFKGIQWHMESPLISGDGASYKVYIDIQAV